MNAWRLALRNMRREWRLAEVRTLVAALLLAVLALGSVATLASRIDRAIVAGAAQLIGGDAGVSAPARIPAALAERAHELGLETSRTASFPTVAFAGQRSQMLDVMAADGAWPLRGQLQVDTPERGQHATHGPSPGHIYLDHRAMTGLGVAIGQRIELGGRKLEVAARSLRQPDGGELIALAPRAVMNLDDARQMGLLARGSRARHVLLVAGTPAARQAWQRWAMAHLPANGELVTPARVQQRMRSAFDRAGSFLRLTALLAALLAGVAIALAARQYARRKTDEVALLRALGMPRRQIGWTLAAGMTLLAIPAAVIGALVALGASQLAWQFARQLFADTPTVMPLAPVIAAACMGLAVMAGFALPPLARLTRLAPVAVFRRQLARPQLRNQWPYLLPAVVSFALVWLQSHSLGMAGILAASLLGVAVLALLLSAALLWLVRHLAPGIHPGLRLGLAALGRRRALSMLQGTALALGLTAMLSLGVIAPALLDGWRRELPADTPNWFVLNLQSEQRAGFRQQLALIGADQLNMMPLAVGKLSAINGTPVEDIQFDDPRTRRQVERQVRLSWSAELPPSNQVIAGQWHGASPAQAEVSIDENWRDRYHLAVGDTLRFEIGSKTLEARVGSIRKVDWSSFRVNFFLLLDPAHAGGLPHTWLASYHLPSSRGDRLAALSRDYPNLSLIDVDALLNRVRGIIGQVAGAVRWVLVFSLLAGALVLAAALSTTQRERQHEAALLRTLGAHRRQLRMAAACEFALLGLVAAVTAALGAAGSGVWLARSVFDMPHFVPPVLPILASTVVAAILVMLLGLIGTRRVTRTPPLDLLRRA